MMNANPVQRNERNVGIDMLRGFALLGILIMNLPQFFNPSFVYGVYGVPTGAEGADRVGDILVKLFVEGKFFTIFSFLFGLGFYIFMSRAEAKSPRPNRLYLRRITALLLIGALHFVFGWTGDILHLYGIGGLLLLLFYRRRNKTILIWIASLVVVWFGMFGLSFIGTPEQAQESLAEGRQLLPQMNAILENLTYPQWIDYQLRWVAPALAAFEPIFLLAILAMFLVGLYAGKRNWFSNLAANRKTIRRVWLVSLTVNAPIMAVLALLLTRSIDLGFRHEAVVTVLVQFSGITMSLLYILTFLLLLARPKPISWLRPIGYVGQMALTNYLGQTVVCIVLGTVFHLHGVGSVQAIVLSLMIYVCQVALSALWLSRFRFGPLEWLWRTFTYLAPQPLRLREKKAKELDAVADA